MFNPLLALATSLQTTSLRLDLSQSTWAVPSSSDSRAGDRLVRGAALVSNPQLRRFRWNRAHDPAGHRCTAVLVAASAPVLHASSSD